MAQIRFSPEADEDLAEIQNHLAFVNPGAAAHYRSRFEAAFRLLSRFPRAGHNRPDFPDDRLRAWTVWPYLIVYEVVGKRVEVVRIVHGGRSMPSLFFNY